MVIALLRQPRWAGLALVAVAMSVLFWWLGTWQWGRHVERAERNDAIAAALAEPPAPLAAVVAEPDQVPESAVYRSVTATGTYLATSQVLQRNPRGRSGFAVITPLALTDGGTLWVDRGWVPASSTDINTPATDVAPPAGPVEVTVRMRSPQPPSGRQAPTGQIYDITPQSMGTSPGDDLPEPVYASYGELVDQDPAPDPALELPEPGDVGIGVHLFYAIQWWLFIVIAIAGYLALLRRESRETARDAPSVDESADTLAPAADQGSDRPRSLN
jgi:cytochrome oxidase assembly protein ShyY1